MNRRLALAAAPLILLAACSSGGGASEPSSSSSSTTSSSSTPTSSAASSPTSSSTTSPATAPTTSCPRQRRRRRAKFATTAMQRFPGTFDGVAYNRIYAVGNAVCVYLDMPMPPEEAKGALEGLPEGQRDPFYALAVNQICPRHAAK